MKNESFLRKYASAAISGVLLALSFPSSSIYPLAWLALVPLFLSTRDSGPRETFTKFLVSGFVFYAILLQWLLSHYHWVGGWALLGHLALSLALALYWGLLGLLIGWVRGRSSTVYSNLCLIALWPSMEFLQSVLFTGFGWGALAYSQGSDLMLLQWASIGGTALITTIIVAFNVLVSSAFSPIPRQGASAPCPSPQPGVKKGRLTCALIALALLAASHLGGAALLKDADFGDEALKVAILQANFPLEMKWDPDYEVEMVRNSADKSRALAEYESVDLMVWPEALITTTIDSPEVNRIVTSLVKQTDTPLYTGVQRWTDGGVPLNSSCLISPDGDELSMDFYDKVHLAPFGEYVPLAKYLPFIEKAVPMIGDMQPGESQKLLTLDEKEGVEFGPLICFEMLFDGMSEELRRQGADFLVVITNLGWFGASSAIAQELDITRVRAIETRLSIVHCANTGISGVFDPWGRFTPILQVIDGHKQFLAYPEGTDPRSTIMERLVGVLPVARPESRLLPIAPSAFRWLILCVSALLLSACLTHKPKARLND